MRQHLKQANIGISMGSGTDVAKDASAMVSYLMIILTIVNAIEIGKLYIAILKNQLLTFLQEI